MTFNASSMIAETEPECTEFILYHTIPQKQIWRMKPDGSEKTLLREFGWFAQYSPDGSKIAFSEPYSNGIWVMNSDCTNEVKLTSFGMAPTWSPDGERLAFHHWKFGGRRIWVIEANGSNPHILSPNFGNFADWSPDGTKIVYGRPGSGGIWVMNSDGTGEVEIHPAGDLPEWSPDGKHIAFWGYGKGLSIVDPDGSNFRNITRYIGTSFPTWSPNGTKIAYADGRGIWMINADGTEDHEVISVGAGPFWWAEINAAIDIKPDTLDSKNQRRRWITLYIELPQGYNPSDISVDTILLNNTITIDPDAPMEIGDYDKDGFQDLMVKINRQDLISFSSRDEATLTITGKIFATHFEGTDTIRIIGR